REGLTAYLRFRPNIITASGTLISSNAPSAKHAAAQRLSAASRVKPVASASRGPCSTAHPAAGADSPTPPPDCASYKTCAAACYNHPSNCGPVTPPTPLAAPPKLSAPPRNITHRSRNLRPPIYTGLRTPPACIPP